MGAREQFAEAAAWNGANDAPAAPARVIDLPVRSRAARTATQQNLKRILDIVIASAMLLAFAPVMLLASLFIKLDSQGPVLFRQRRLGLNGKPFAIFKFRTMSVMEDGCDVVQVREGDTRVTGVGRFLRKSSIDELPQLVNVIRGDMSLVGPRPHAIAHDEMYALLIPGYVLRQRVRPGITGWAQVHGLRGETPTVDVMRRRVEMDIWYAAHWNAKLDTAILLRTPLEILRRRNAH